MNNIFIFLSISFALGIICSYYTGIPWIYPLLLLLFLIPSLFLYKHEKRFVVAISLLFFLLGIAYEGVYSHLPQSHIAHISLPQRTAVIGVVDSAVETRRYSEKKTMTTFTMEAKKYKSQKGWEQVQGKVKVNAYNIAGAIPRNRPHAKLSMKNNKMGENVVSPVQYGDEIRLWGELKRPRQATNPGQFDYRDYLKKYDIHVLMNVYGERSVRVYGQSAKRIGHSEKKLEAMRHALCAMPRNVLRAIFNLRTRLKQQIDTYLSYPYNTLLSALLIGMRSEIPSHTRDTFVKTGTVHLLAISGLHISIMVSALYYVCSLLVIPRWIRTAIVVVFIGIYSVLAGFRFPVMRAGLMGTIIILGLTLDRHRHMYQALFLAFLLLLIWTPHSLFLPGFQLSFVTVFSIVLLTPHVIAVFPADNSGEEHNTKVAFLSKYIRTGYAVSIAVLLGASLLIVYFFNVLSISSIIANIIIFPLSALAILSGIIFVGTACVHPGVATVCAWLPLLALKCLVGIIAVLSQIPFTFWYIRTPHVLFIIAYYTVAATMFMLRKRFFGQHVIMWMGGVWLLVITLIVITQWGGHTEVYILDAGSGDSAYITVADGTNVLINTGRGESSFETRWVLKPFLLTRGVNHIDAVFIASLYKRHRGGLATILANFQVHSLFVPQGYTSHFSSVGTEVVPVAAGNQAKAPLSIVYGPRAHESGRYSDTVLVFKLMSQDRSFLFCAYLNTEMIQEIINMQDVALDCDALFVHFADGVSQVSRQDFLEVVAPRVVIINETDPAYMDLMENICEAIGAALYNTYHCGAVRLIATPRGRSWQITQYGTRSVSVYDKTS